MIQLASAGNRYGAERVTEDQRHLVSLHLRFSALAGGLIVCGILLVTLLLWHNTMLTRAHRDLHGLADRAARTGAGGDRRQPGEVGIPGDDEPRNPHADECRDRAVGGAARTRSWTASSSTSPIRSTNSSNNLLRLLNDILDISKLDAGKVELEAQPFAPAALVDGAVSIFEAQALEKGLLVRAQVDDELPAALVGDEARLRQVMLNLMSNAIKFTESGQSRSPRAASARTDGAASIEYRSRDTGIGIAPDRIGCLFNDFAAGRRLDQPPLWRHRPRSRDLQAYHRADGRRYPRRVHSSTPDRRSASR